MSDSNTDPKPLHVRYTDPDGNLTDLVLEDKPITIGRSPDADIITLDERASRMHCGIRIWDGEYYLKDLKSKNGTYLNNQRVEMAKVKPGDKIRLGNTILHIDDKEATGADTGMSSVQNEMSEGKGYNTILREIVQNTEKPVAKPMSPSRESTESEQPEPSQATTANAQHNTPRSGKSAKIVSPPPENSKDSSEKSTKSDSKITRRKPTAIKIKRNP